MMNVFIVTVQDLDATVIKGVFASEELAEKYCEEQEQPWALKIEEWPIEW